MTLAPPASSGATGPEGPERDDRTGAATDEAEGFQPIVRARSSQLRQRRRRRRILVAQAGVAATALVVLVVLLWVGWTSALRITGGRTNEATDPSAPGYVAVVRPTEVTLLALVAPEPGAGGTEATAPAGTGADPDAADAADGADGADGADPVSPAGGRLATMLLVIERADGTAPTVVPVPSRLALWDFQGAEPQEADDVFAGGGLDALATRLGADLTFGVTESRTVPVAAVDDLVRSTGPLTIQLPDDVLAEGDGDGPQVRYRAGELTLGPGEVGEFLSFDGVDESATNRALRVELLWKALLEQLDGQVPDTGEGPGQEELAEVLARISGEAPTFDLVPLQEVPLFTDPPTSLFRIDQPLMPEWVARRVPFPTSAYPGQRVRIELVNGTRDEVLQREAARAAVAAGGEILYTRNAESFDVEETRVDYEREEAVLAATLIAENLGVAMDRVESLPADVDVAVVVGGQGA